MDILDAFQDLNPPSRSEAPCTAFNGVQLPAHRGCHLGKDQSRRPAILIGAPSSERGTRAPSIALENLRVEHGVSCVVTPPSGSTIRARFSVVHCLSAEPNLQAYFLRVMATVLDSLPERYGTRELSAAIDNLARLFHALQQAPSRPARGLWAELLVIGEASSPDLMIEAWHSEPTERTDFCLDRHRIEVKCSGDRGRRHHFSLEQLCPPSGVTTLVASVHVESVAAGSTIGVLWDQAREYVAGRPDLRMKVERVCMATLGSSWEEAREKAYDLRLARESLAFYDAAAIPKIPADLPQGVSEVHFLSDLSLAEPIDVRAWRSRRGLFGALPAV